MVDLVYKLLLSKNIRCDYDTLNKRVLSHPYYPALESIVDTLDEMNIEYKAIRSDKLFLNELDYPLLIFVNVNNIKEFRLIKNANDLINNKILLNSWDGITLLVNKRARNSEFSFLVSSNFLHTSFFILLFITIYAFIFFNKFNILDNFIYFFDFIGVFVCWHILMHKNGKNSIVLNHLCGSGTNDTCSEVLNSKQAKVFNNITLGDLGFVYFLSNLFFLWFMNLSKHNFINSLFLVFSSTFLLSFVSIYLQFKILKSWCKLCLFLVLIIWLQYFIFLFYHKDIFKYLKIFKLEIFEYTILSITIFFASVITYIINQYLDKINKLNNYKINLTKWQRNPFLFINHLNAQRQIDYQIWENDLIIGNRNAKIKILYVSNPYCSPCAETHFVFEELLNLFGHEICIILRVLSNSNNYSDKRRIAFNYLLNALDRGFSIEQVLGIWFTKMNLEEFINYFKLFDNVEDFSFIISQHHNWSKLNNIEYTPTVFINGFELISPYNIEHFKDIIIFYLEYITQTNVVRNTKV
jgi:uncharacterized membrane protein